MLAKDYVQPDEKMGDAVLRWLDEHYQEEKADAVNEALLAKLPRRFLLVKPFIGYALDAMTPGLVLSGLRAGLARLGLAKNDRQLANPFTRS